MVTFSPSRSSLKLIWQDKREYSSRWSELSSRSLSSSPTPGSFATKSGSTCTWQVAHEQQPPHSARSSSKPLSRMISITDRPLSPSTVFSSPSRVTTTNFGIYALLKRSEEHTSELQSLMRNSYAVSCLKKKITTHNTYITTHI